MTKDIDDNDEEQEEEEFAGSSGGGRGGGSSSSGSSSRDWRAFREESGGGVESWILLACVARARGDAGGTVSMFRRALALDPHCLEGESCCC